MAFYKNLNKKLDEYQIKILRKENRFLDWQYFDMFKTDINNYF